MRRIGRRAVVAWFLLLSGGMAGGAARADDQPARAPYAPDAKALRAAYSRAESARERYAGKVVRESIEPHWFDAGHKLWYRNDGRDGTREFILVDAAKATRARAFDHARLAKALAKASETPVDAEKLPFDAITFVDDGRVVEFRVKGDAWHCDLQSYDCKKGAAPGKHATADPEPDSPGDRGREAFRGGGGGGRVNRDGPVGPIGMFGPIPTPPAPVRSPDGKWAVEVRDYNIALAPVRERSEGRDRPGRRRDEPAAEILTDDGRPDHIYGDFAWSPDSKTLVAWQTTPARKGEVHLIESSPRDGGRARLHTRPYDLPGDPVPVHELWVYNLETKKAIRPDVPPIDFGPNFVRWKDGGHRFTFSKTDRGHQRFRLFEVDARSGEARTLIDEKSETFVNTYTDPFVRELGKSKKVLFKSERDGWAHLYLIDAETGKVKNQVTRGEWVVRHVDRVDEEERQIWFQASGRNPGEDPYHVHFYRVDFDGSNPVSLTDGDGDHTVRYSPDRKHLIDTYSRVDLPPVHTLRRTSDGSLVVALEKADASALESAGWTTPEVFKAKGRDGKTDIWGVVYRPSTLDPSKAYPVIESIYAGPHGAHVPKRFAAFRATQALAELGFIVVQIDGMGTANRSKAFHDVCWHNVADAGFPDRIPWIRALAAKYPYVDAGRVGIFGTSAGGQNAAGAVLFHPEFYKVAVAACGCHDNRMDKASWNEQWMGYPAGAHYAANSNITHAKNLVGKLLLIVGELDTNVPPESTYRLVDALIKAGKDFDLLTVPGMGHSDGGPYGERRRRDFFVRHLHHVEPPDRNAPAPAEATADTLKADAAVARAGHADEANRSDKATAKLKDDEKPKQESKPKDGETPKDDKKAKDDGKKDSAATGPPDGGSPLGDLDAAHPVMREVIERYSADHRLIEAKFPLAGEPARMERLRGFLRSWLDALPSLDFDRLDRAGKVDYLLLKNHLNRQLAQLDLERHRAAEVAPLLPFAATIYDLDDARRRMEWPEPAKVAATLAGLEKAVKQARKEVEGQSGRGAGKDGKDSKERPKISPSAGVRAARAAQRLRMTLSRWYGFYDGYDPLFTWWAADPFKAADRALTDYASFLGERLGGVRSGDTDTIVGDPIGRDALRAELDAALIPYTPEQLVALANKEFAWCEERMKAASREMGFGDDWKKALEHVKTRHVDPGKQPALIRDLALEAIKFLDDRDLVTIPPLAREGWRMDMMSPERQKLNPFFTGGEVISVAFPTSTMSHEQKMMSLRGNNIHFARATVHHELIPGHHLQLFSAARYRPYRELFSTPFLVEGWPLYWETLLWDLDFGKSPEDRVGMLFWRMHRCARIIFSLRFHLGEMTPQECIDFLVDRVGHERENATAEVRRSFAGMYGPLYQAAYMLGGLQLRALRKELVGPGKMTDKAFHDAVLRENAIPIELIRASLSPDVPLERDFKTTWTFYGSP